MRGLLSDVVPFGVVRVFPITGKCLSEDGVQWLLDSSAWS